MSTKDNYKKAFSAGAKGRTNFLVFGVLAVAIAATSAFVSKKTGANSDAAAQVMRAPEGAGSVADANKASEVYLNTLKDSNRQEIEQAQRTGTSAVSTLTSKAVAVDDGTQKVQPTTVVISESDLAGANQNLPQIPQFAPPEGGHMSPGQAGVQNGQQSGYQQNRALSAQVGELLNTWAAPGQSIYVNQSAVASAGDASAQASATQAAAAQVAQTQAAAAAVQPTVLIPAGKMMSAVLDTEMVSDDGGPVLATVVAGPYKGAKLIGAMSVTRNSAKLNFNTLSFKGATAQISAVGMDPDTGRAGMADDVDKHWFEKYGMVFVSSLVGGYGEAASQVGTTVTQTAGSTVVQQDPLSAKVRSQVALGKAGAAVAQQFAQDASQIQTTIKLNQARPIGVLFTKDVTSQ